MKSKTVWMTLIGLILLAVVLFAVLGGNRIATQPVAQQTQEDSSASAPATTDSEEKEHAEKSQATREDTLPGSEIAEVPDEQKQEPTLVNEILPGAGVGEVSDEPEQPSAAGEVQTQDSSSDEEIVIVAVPEETGNGES